MNNRLRTPNEASQKDITINDIAEELGVSKTTISRAISGKGRIGTDTRDKVLTYIEEHGYRPNLIAKSLAVSKTFNIAVTLPVDADVHEIPFFQICLQSITETAMAQDYDVVLSIMSGQDISGLKRLVRNHKVDGVILTRLVSDDRAVAYLKETGLPFVVIGSTDDDSIIQIDSDQAAGCREMTGFVLENGLVNNVLLAGTSDHQVNKDRYSGFASALEAAGMNSAEAPVFWDMTSNERTEKVMPSVMEKKPDCLVCMDDAICGRVLHWLQKNGFGIPSDVRVVSFYDSVAMEQHIPPVTALHINVRELGSAAGAILLDLLNGKSVSQRTLVGYELSFRDSSRTQ